MSNISRSYRKIWQSTDEYLVVPSVRRLNSILLFYLWDFNWNHICLMVTRKMICAIFSTRSKNVRRKKRSFETNKSTCILFIWLLLMLKLVSRFFWKVDFILQWIESHTPCERSVLLEMTGVYANFFVEQFEYIDDRWMPRPTIA